MSITRKMLKGMGLTEDQQDTILEAHTETVDEIKAERDRYKSDAENLPKLQKQLEQMQSDLETAKNDGWKDKYDTVKKEFDTYKANVTAKETKEAKEAAARAYYQEKGITGKALDIAMRGSGAEIAALELSDGKIKDTAALDTLISGDFSGLVGTLKVEGASTANPPANTGGGTMTKRDIYKKDDKGRYLMDATERQTALAKMMSEKQD